MVAGGETQAFYSRHDRTKRPIAVTSRQRLYLNWGADVIDREDSIQRMTSWDLLYYLGRANFDGVKSNYLPKGEPPERAATDGEARYEHGRLVTGVQEVGDKVEISYEDVRAFSKDGSTSNGNQSGRDKQGTLQADFLIAADGPSSTLRRLLVPSASKRTYAGYVAFRGTCPESELSVGAEQVFVERFTFYHGRGTQILAYTIPGADGALDKGKRLVNWVWYCNYEQGSEEYQDIMTDKDGGKHQFTLPTGGNMQDRVWERQMAKAKEILPEQFAEIVTKTTMPFVQAITDVAPPSRATKIGRLLSGKAALVGDALAGFRPHTAASTSQAAFDALLLERVFQGQISWDEYEKQALSFAESWQKRGVMLGQRSQFGEHPLQS